MTAPVHEWTCTRCKVRPAGRANSGPCHQCAGELRADADHRYRGWLLIRFLAAFNGHVWP